MACRDKEHFDGTHSDPNFDIVIAHVHKEQRSFRGDLIVHASTRDGVYVGIQNSDDNAPKWVLISHEQAKDIAAGLMYAVQPEVYDKPF